MSVELIKDIMKKTAKTEEQLKKEIEEEYKQLDSSIPEETRKTLALRRFIASYRKVLSSRAETYEGIFIGVSSIMDYVANKRKAASEFFRENRAEAIKRGVTDKDGNPLYFATPEEIAKMPDWAKKRLGTKLPENDFQRIAYGIAKLESGMVPMQFRIRGDNCKVSVPLFKPMKFNGMKTNASTDALMMINDSGKLSFEITGKMDDSAVLSMFKGKFKDKIINIAQIEEYVQAHQEFTAYCIMRVFAVRINLDISQSGSKTMFVDDESMEFFDKDSNPIPPLPCWVPEHINIDFPEKSDVYIIGKPQVTDRGKSINVYGIYVPEYIKRITPQPVSSDEEEMKF